jgi:hypothetical protein
VESSIRWRRSSPKSYNIFHVPPEVEEKRRKEGKKVAPEPELYVLYPTMYAPSRVKAEEPRFITKHNFSKDAKKGKGKNKEKSTSYYLNCFDVSL